MSFHAPEVCRVLDGDQASDPSWGNMVRNGVGCYQLFDKKTNQRVTG